MPVPAEDQEQEATASHLIVAPFYKEENSGALYVHKDLVEVRAPHADDDHIGPVVANERFGDVESWVSYAKEYAGPLAFITWNSKGLKATIDYHVSKNEPGRCAWYAECPFTRSEEWDSWMRLATGQAVAQRVAIERLEEMAEDIVEPDQGELLNLLRNLRANVTATAQTELRPDGTTSVAFNQDKRVQGAGSVELPPEIRIRIQVLAGHTDETQRPVRYELRVRLRASVDDNAHLALRFSIQQAERVLEEVFAERVAAAKALLGDSFKVLRAAG